MSLFFIAQATPYMLLDSLTTTTIALCRQLLFDGMLLLNEAQMPT